ncbi:MAG TPA: ATP-binding protein [Candidatus Moranbacteria bacterium]|nr:ATP-binding protein [Candidatus Moranbacteria bacterium]
MDILNQSIKSLNFADIIAFCQEKNREGIQIDYKKEYPQKGIAKHFASFSNTRGGILIIGVEEDRKSGVPIAWESIECDAKIIEKINQEASNVEPIPAFDVHITDEINGKRFVLVRVYEGDKTPYYVQNDSNVWVRTGNISNSIDIASPDGLELLFGKKEKAEKARNNFLSISDELHEAAIGKEEKRIREELRKEAEKEGSTTIFRYEKTIGVYDSICKITLQPYFPGKSLTTPKKIKDDIDSIRFRNRNFVFPDLNVEPSPKGIRYFSYQRSREILESQVVLGQGLIQDIFTASRKSPDEKSRIISLRAIAVRIFGIFKFADRFYDKYGYQGVLLGNIEINGATDVLEDVLVRRMVPIGSDFWEEDKTKESLLSDYLWEIKIDTRILKEKDELRKYYEELLEEIYWDFGFEEIGDGVLDKFLEENGFTF